MTGDTLPLAVSVMPLENRRATILYIAMAADRLGFNAFFLPESWAHDATILLAEAAVRTEQISLASGILGVWGRSAATLAMAASSLHDVSGGRFILGLGASTSQLTEGLHDVPFKAPVAQMRRIITQARALLRGERIPTSVAAEARPLRLNLPAAPDLPIYLAGLAPATVRLAGELCDGWLPFMFPYSRLSEGSDLLREGAAKASRQDRLPEVCPMVPTVVAESAAEAREGAGWFVAFYLNSMGPLYRRTLMRQGFEKEVQAIAEANPTRETNVVPPSAEALLKQLTIFGTPADVGKQLQPWYEAGASLPVLLLQPNLSNEQIDFILEAFAAQRQPR